MMKYVALTVVILAIFPREFGVSRLSAEEVTSNSIKTWTDAVKLLDSLSVEEAMRGEKWLRQELAKPETPVEAAWALGLFCCKRADLAALERVINAIGQRYPNPPMSVAIAIERMKLSLALFQDNAAAAAASMKKMTIAALNDQLPKEDRQLNASSIGAIVGMLEAEAAKSPIALETLNQIKGSLSAAKKDDISGQFQFAYEASKAKAKLLNDTFASIENKGVELIESEQRELAKAQEELGISIEDAEEALRLTKLNTEEQTKANRISLKRIQAYVAKLEQNWKVPTPGHPGPEKPAPVKPSKSSIRVDEYETKYETETEIDSAGNRVNVRKAKEVRRPQAEIDREREQRYIQLMEIYRYQKAQYDDYIAKYRNVLATWIQADRDRREKMQEDKRDSLQKASDLDQQNDALEAEKAAAVEQVLELRARLKPLQTQSELLAEVLRTAATQKPESSFRPGFFETVFAEKEKNRLLTVYRESTH